MQSGEIVSGVTVGEFGTNDHNCAPIVYLQLAGAVCSTNLVQREYYYRLFGHNCGSAYHYSNPEIPYNTLLFYLRKGMYVSLISHQSPRVLLVFLHTVIVLETAVLWSNSNRGFLGCTPLSWHCICSVHTNLSIGLPIVHADG